MKKVKRPLGDKIFRTIGFIFMFFIASVFIFAIIWMILNSFRYPNDYTYDSFAIFDFQNYTLENVYTLFTLTVDTSVKQVGILEMIMNTLIITAGCIVLSISIPVITGYIVAKYNFFIKRVMDILAIVTMIIPTVGSTMPLYRLIDSLGLMDTYWAMFIQYAGGFGFTYLLFRNFFSAIPTDYAEAAFLDGASNIRVFWNVMLPQSVPIMISVMVMKFIGVWNDYFTPFLYMEGRPTVAVGVNMIYQKYAVNRQNYPVAFAAMSFSALVSLLIYACFSKTIMESMSVGGLKG